MKRLLNKLSTEKADLLGKVRIGDTSITVAVDGEMVLGLVNGNKIVDAGLYENFIERMVPVLTMVIAKVYRDNWDEGATLDIYEKDWDTKNLYPSENFLEALLEDLNRHLDEKSINIIKDESPTENKKEIEDISKSIEIDALISNLDNYSKQIANVAKYAARSIDRATVLTKRRLPVDMWGAEKVQDFLDKVKSNLSNLEEVSSKLDMDAATSSRAIHRLNHRLKTGKHVEADSRKYISSVLIPEIHESYDSAKKVTAEILRALGSLNGVDKMFREHVGNPAGLFLHTNVMDDLEEATAVLTGFLSESSSIEANVMEPIEYLGTNED